MPQRPCTGFPAETMTKRYSLCSINFIGFLRHKRESLNDRICGMGRCCFHTSPKHHSMLPTSGYSLAGCSPAEPASASPDTFYYFESVNKFLASKGSLFLSIVHAITSNFAASFTRILVLIPRSFWRPSRRRWKIRRNASL